MDSISQTSLQINMNIDKNNYNILVVEDNPGDYMLIEEYLPEHILNPTINHVKKFQDALEILHNDSLKFDIVLLDLTLPDISKEELIKQLKNITHTFPVIILTGYTDLEFATKSLAVGVSDYLLKDTLTPLVLYKSILYAKERFGFFKSLLKSQKKYRDLFDLNPNPMWVYEIETLKFLEVNNSAVELYGFSAKEFLELTLKDIRPEEDILLLERAIEKVRKGEEDITRKNIFRHKRKDGSIIMVEISSRLIKYNDKKAEVVLVSDITEKLSHIESIKEQNFKLKEIAWMQSHVVRAPVARLMSIIDVLKSAYLTLDEKEQMLNQIVIASNEIDQVVKDIVKKAESVIKQIK